MPDSRRSGIEASVVRRSMARYASTDVTSLTASGADTAALIAGAGTSTTPIATATADKNFVGLWSSSSATTGDSRGVYIRHYLTSTGSGEALRVYGSATVAGCAAGGTANGMHCSFSEGASATIAGQSSAARFTYDVAAATRVVGRNSSVLILETVLGANVTTHADCALIRVVQSATNSLTMRNLLRLPVPGAKTTGDLFLARHADATCTHGIQICDEAGTKYWIQVTTDTPGD
jgi:hypothetical protein